MGSTRNAVTKWVGAAIVVGTLSFAGAGAAGAATPTTTGSGPAAAVSTGVSNRIAHFSCTRATKALTRIERVESRIAAHLPKLHAAEAKAKAAGRSKRAARIEARITRFERPALSTRLKGLA